MLVILLTLIYLRSCAQQTPDDFKISELPLSDSTPPNEMYSGFFPINQSALEPEGNLFFWLIKSKNLSEETPFFIWLSGGPGSSSVQAQFKQHGIVRISQDPIDQSKPPNITFSSQSWVQIGHILYVDNPIGTGYSYNVSVPLRSTHTQIAIDFFYFLQHFLDVFTQFQNNPLYLTGESYAGKYIPYMAEQILKQNEANANIEINLKGIMMSNPLLLPIVQRTQMHDLAQNLGLVGPTQLFQLYQLQNQCFSSYSSDHVQARNKCNKVRDFINRVDGDVDLQDVRQLISSEVQPWELYMSGNYNSSVLSAFHVQDSPKIPIYQKYSAQVSKALDRVFIESSYQLVSDLIKRIPVLISIGQFDGLDGVEGQRTIIELMDLHDKAEFKHKSQYLFQYETELGEWKIGGYYRQVENFSWVIIPGAGHLVAETQLDVTISLISFYLLNNHTIPCIDSPNFNCTHAHHIQCKAMDYCNGDNGFCKNGVCRCFNGYFGADCSMQITLVDTSQNSNFTIEPYGSIVLQTVPLKNTNISMVLSSDNPFNLYAMRNASLDDPVPLSQYDVVYKNVREYLDIPNKNVVESNSDFILIKNPNSHAIVVQLSHKSLVQQIVTKKQNSFFAPFNGGFVLAMIFLILAVVSIILNFYIRKRLQTRTINIYQISEC